MKKRLNTVFFSLCFLGSVMAEAYFIQAGADNLFSVIALGVVVLITGYLCLDSIRSKLSEGGKEIRNYIDQMYHEETQRWNERFSEIQNLQKATYTATKKNTVTLSEQLEELIDRMEALEGNNTKTLQKLLELQKKSLEGQKNALSLQINYNKENTKQLIKSITETGNQAETIELMNKLMHQLELSTQIIQNELQNMNITVQAPNVGNPSVENNWKTEAKVENLTETGWDVEAEVELDDKLSGWSGETDPIIEEIDNSWNNITEQSIHTDWSTEAVEEEPIPEWNSSESVELRVADWQLGNEQEPSTDNTWNNDTVIADAPALEDTWGNIDDELNKLIGGLGEEELPVENTPDIIPTVEEEIMTEVVEVVSEPVADEIESEKPEIKPLYDDPNKALSADEIAALFASFGQ